MIANSYQHNLWLFPDEVQVCWTVELLQSCTSAVLIIHNLDWTTTPAVRGVPSRAPSCRDCRAAAPRRRPRRTPRRTRWCQHRLATWPPTTPECPSPTRLCCWYNRSNDLWYFQVTVPHKILFNVNNIIILIFDFSVLCKPCQKLTLLWLLKSNKVKTKNYWNNM